MRSVTTRWRRVRRWTLARRLVALLFLALLAWGARSREFWLHGSTPATRLFDAVPMLDPLAAIEAGLASGGVTPTMLLGAGTLVLVALLLGPVFCGWLCPLGLLLDLAQEGRTIVLRALGRRKRPGPAPGPMPTGVRIASLGAVLGIALVAGVPLFQALSPIHLLVRALLFGATAGLAVVGALIVLESFLPRVWCRVLCPLGALYAVLGRRSPLRVRIDPEEAGKVPCRQCTVHCPMGIRVMEDYSWAGKRSVDDPACTRCGSCLDACPRAVLGLRFGEGRSPPEARSRRLS